MAGEAKTTQFLLGTATVMLGPQALLRDLTPDLHSIGLTKAVTFSAEPTYTDLTQGVKNSLVFSTLTSNVVKAAMEVYEYTAANLTWALGLDGSSIVTFTEAATLVSATSAASADLILQVGEGALFSVGDWVMLQVGADDHVLLRKVTVIVTDTLTVDLAVAVELPIDTNVKKVNAVSVGSKVNQPFLSAKIVGTLADGSETTMLLPKVRITNGFNVAFQTDNYANMPFELSVFDLVAADPNFAMFAGAQAMIFTQ